MIGRTIPYVESHAMIAPTGGWLAYTSDRSGQQEVYLQAFPVPGPAVQVSVGGGSSPLWSHDGRRIYFWTWGPALPGTQGEPSEEREGQQLNTLMAVDVEIGDDVHLSRPRMLFRQNWVQWASGRSHYDVTVDDRFLLLQGESQPIRHIRIVLGWLDTVEPF